MPLGRWNTTRASLPYTMISEPEPSACNPPRLPQSTQCRRVHACNQVTEVSWQTHSTWRDSRGRCNRPSGTFNRWPRYPTAICDLHKRENQRVHVDSGYVVTSRQIRERLKGVVFLSVPHWGTNIADWVHFPQTLCTRSSPGCVSLFWARDCTLNLIETQVTGIAAALADAGMLLALKDARTEANENYR